MGHVCMWTQSSWQRTDLGVEEEGDEGHEGGGAPEDHRGHRQEVDVAAQGGELAVSVRAWGGWREGMV
jgi:hypothetical protein